MRKILTISSIVFGGIFLFAQNSEAKITVKQVQQKFKFKKYSTAVLTKFIKEIDENDATIFESIPGEIIGWTSTDKGNQTQTETFKIKNGTLTKINTTVSESDLKKIDKFAPKNSHFELNNGLYDETKYPSVGKVLKKLNDGTYLLSSRITLEFNSQEPHKIYDLEYQTKDFKNFVLKRIKDSESDKWTIVK